MQGYYRAALDVQRYGRRVFERCLPPRATAQVERRLDEHFSVVDHRLGHYGADPFAGRPALALEAVILARDLEVGLSAATMDAAAQAVASADAASLAEDPQAQGRFLELLVDPRVFGAQSPVELAAELGLLDRLVPEFAASRGRMQHDSFHVYTVDRHSLYAVEFLKAIARGEYRKDYPMATAIHLGLSDLVPLYLATLLHDAGKAFGDQCEQGAAIAARAAARAQLPRPDADRCALLVREHLTLPLLSQKRDLGDPLLVEQLAQRVRDKRTLDELYLLGLADMAAVSPDFLTAWKVALLDELYLLTAAHLARRGRPAARRVGADEPEGLPARYYSLFPVHRRRRHRQLLDRLRQSGVPVLVEAGDGPGALRLTVAARDRPGLLAHLTAELDELRLPVVAADIFSVPGAAPLALDVFRLAPERGLELGQAWVGNFEAAVAARLSDDAAGRLLSEPPGPLPALHRPGRRPIPTRVSFSEDPAGERTIVEVETADQPSVLRRITAAFASLEIGVEVARVLTEARRVADVFYVPRLDEATRAALEQRVQTYLRRS
jgi:[protein-PII] uridylyltransferase